jgi:hypothetical protein
MTMSGTTATGSKSPSMSSFSTWHDALSQLISVSMIAPARLVSGIGRRDSRSREGYFFFSRSNEQRISTHPARGCPGLTNLSITPSWPDSGWLSASNALRLNATC